MPKKGQTNNPNGRPPKRPEDRIRSPQRQLGRVDDATWLELTTAAKASGLSFRAWAVDILLKAIRKSKK